MLKSILIWNDPKDHDQGTNKGVEIFKDNETLLEWLNSKIQECPHLKAEAFAGCNSIPLKKKAIITKYEFGYD